MEIAIIVKPLKKSIPFNSAAHFASYIQYRFEDGSKEQVGAFFAPTRDAAIESAKTFLNQRK